MDTRLTLLPLLLALPLALAPAVSQSPDQESEQDEHHEHEGPLAEAMEHIGSGMRSLRKLMTEEGQAQAAIEIARDLQSNAATALGHPPAPPAGSDGTATALWNIAFRRQILGVLEGMLDLEQALVEGRLDDARSSYAHLNKLKAAGHDRFQIEEE
jgi:hypothetical protein